jgi:DNA-binding transcriptional LysR family regulator
MFEFSEQRYGRSMDRFARISDVWSWLPTFRAVGETESIRGAAERLRVAPSAVSRTVKLLEAALGVPLVERVGRRIRLNDAGAALLGGVRDAMRGVDDSLASVVAQPRGKLVIATPGTIGGALVVPALAKLARRQPEVVAYVEALTDDATSRLLRGALDVACTTRPLAHAALRTVRLGALAASVYCGQGHPLWRRRAVPVAELVTYGFVAPPPDAAGVPVEGWPATAARRIEVVTSSLNQGLELCRSGRYVGVFPDRLTGGTLHRLPFSEIAPVPVYVVTRAPVRRADPTIDAFVAQLAAELRAPTARPRAIRR